MRGHQPLCLLNASGAELDQASFLQGLHHRPLDVSWVE